MKTAYAEIILNTAKEAAARIVISEKKAFRYQQELFAAKEEGLRMLLRLKQMLDSKVHEAGMTSLSQQRRIEELEAQLGEAEDIVKDLRVELGELQDELEQVTNQMQLLNEQNSRGGTVASVETSKVDRLNTFQSIISPYPEAQSEIITTSEMKNPLLNGTCEIKQCLHKGNCYTCNSDFSSLVMRHKKPELYRNGCTQRIHALERSLLAGNVSFSGKEDDIKNELSVKEDEEVEDTHVEPFVEADICRVEEKPDKYEGMQADDKRTQTDGIRTPRRKRKRATRFKKYKSPSSIDVPDQIAETCETSCFSDNSFAVPPNYIVGVGEDSQMIENNFQKDPESTLTIKSVSGTAKIHTQVEWEEVTSEVNEEPIKACTVLKNEKLLIDKMELRQENACDQNLEVPLSTPDVEAVDLSLVNSVVSFSNLTEIPTQLVNSKLLKYTFSRKRKKESLSSPDSYCLFEETNMKRNPEEEKNSTLELRSQKSSLITESSGYSWQLEQLAHQLM